jgi:hypothetical protein
MIKAKYRTEDYQAIFSDKEADGLADQERRETSLSNFHSARKFAHFQVVKRINPEDNSWDGIFTIEDKRGNPLPQELDQGFTDVNLAIKAIQRYIESEKGI